jgi:hypothetical protein
MIKLDENDFANEDRTRKFFAHCIEEVEVDI